MISTTAAAAMVLIATSTSIERGVVVILFVRGYACDPDHFVLVSPRFSPAAMLPTICFVAIVPPVFVFVAARNVCGGDAHQRDHLRASKRLALAA